MRDGEGTVFWLGLWLFLFFIYTLVITTFLVCYYLLFVELWLTFTSNNAFISKSLSVARTMVKYSRHFELFLILSIPDWFFLEKEQAPNISDVREFHKTMLRGLIYCLIKPQVEWSCTAQIDEFTFRCCIFLPRTFVSHFFVINNILNFIRVQHYITQISDLINVIIKSDNGISYNIYTYICIFQ